MKPVHEFPLLSLTYFTDHPSVGSGLNVVSEKRDSVKDYLTLEEKVLPGLEIK